jgi:hypothetical protein
MTDRVSVVQGIQLLLRDSKFHYREHTSPSDPPHILSDVIYCYDSAVLSLVSRELQSFALTLSPMPEVRH